MKAQRLSAVAYKEFLHIIRDWRSLGIGIAIPMLLLFLFCYALSLDVDHIPLIVLDRDNTPASRDFTSKFTASPYFSLIRYASGYGDIEHAIDRRDALAALVIPVGFSGHIASGRKAPVQVILDGSDANTATIAMNYMRTIGFTYSANLLISSMHRSGKANGSIPVELAPRVWFNEEMVSRNSIVPGLIAVIMMVIAALLTSLTIAREWETGTMEQLVSTPLKGSELFFGKLIPYYGIGFLDLVLSVLVGRFAFNVPLKGSIFLLFFLSLVFLFGALSFGMLISIATRNQLLSSQLALVTTMLPAFLLSGFIFPIENMPSPIRAVTHIITARYMVAALRGIYLKDASLGLVAGEAIFLALFGIVVTVIALRNFKKRVE